MSAFASLLLFMPTGPAPETQPIPEALAPYVVDGKLRIDDFGWMRGAFDGADDQQKASWLEIRTWSDKCYETTKVLAIAELEALGVKDVSLKGAPLGTPLCSSIFSYNAMQRPTLNWDDFVANEKEARIIFQGFSYGARMAAQSAPYDPAWGSETAWKLMGATVLDQAYRKGQNWTIADGAPVVRDKLKPYLNAHFAAAFVQEDHKNTAKLKAIIDKSGWPSISAVGKQASFSAWLLVQHADHDPAFQLKALRLMEPLAAKGDVSKRNYAYLYDRVHLKLNGKQRFGTQFGGCDGGDYKLQPLEDGKRLDELRIAHDLEPISEYRDTMKKHAGPCRE